MSGTHVLIQTTGWVPELQQDGPLGTVIVSVMLQVSGHEGRWFANVCKTPEELLNVLTDLDQDRDKALATIFGYSGPPAPPKPKTADELFKELEGI